MHIKKWSYAQYLALLLAFSLAVGCSQLKPLREQRVLTIPFSDQLGISPAARDIESSLGVE